MNLNVDWFFRAMISSDQDEVSESSGSSEEESEESGESWDELEKKRVKVCIKYNWVVIEIKSTFHSDQGCIIQKKIFVLRTPLQVWII